MMNLKEFSICLTTCSSRAVLAAIAAGVVFMALAVLPATGQSRGYEVTGDVMNSTILTGNSWKTYSRKTGIERGNPVTGSAMTSAFLTGNGDLFSFNFWNSSRSPAVRDKKSNDSMLWSPVQEHSTGRAFISSRDLDQRLPYEWNRNSFGYFDDPVVSDTVPHPRKVMFRSLMLPGWGQVTNRQIWKVPIVYALLGGLTYYSIYAHGEYTDYRAAYYNIASGNDDFRFGPTPPRLEGAPQESLRFNRNFFRNRRDFTFILIGVAYGLNILDAYIFAHFRDFDVSDDLAHVSALQPDLLSHQVISLRYRIRF